MDFLDDLTLACLWFGTAIVQWEPAFPSAGKALWELTPSLSLALYSDGKGRRLVGMPGGTSESDKQWLIDETTDVRRLLCDVADWAVERGATLRY